MSGPTAPALALAAAAALGLAACGGGDRAAADAFVADANEICTRSAEGQTAIAAGVARTPAEAIANDRRLVELRRRVVQRLARVHAAREWRRQYLEFVATRGAVLGVVEERLRARDAGDEAALANSVARLNGAYEVSDSAAADLGIDVCAGVLPEAERAEVEALTKEIFTAARPARLERICTELVTPAFLELVGGAEQCRAPERPAARSIEVEDVRGVAGVSAQARFIPRGGPEHGRSLIATYVARHGDYLLNSFSQAPPRGERSSAGARARSSSAS